METTTTTTTAPAPVVEKEKKEIPPHIERAKALRASGLFAPGMTMNELLIAGYKAETGCNDFRTFKQWKEAGFTILKGSKGFPVFSRPVGVLKEQKTGEAQADDLYKLFGTCYLFNESQVKKAGAEPHAG